MGLDDSKFIRLLYAQLAKRSNRVSMLTKKLAVARGALSKIMGEEVNEFQSAYKTADEAIDEIDAIKEKE